MKNRTTRAGIAVVACLAVLAGCASSGRQTTGAAASRQSSAASPSSAPQEAASGEILPMRYVTPGNTWADQDYVLNLVNKKLIEDGVNVKVELIRIPWDAWDQKTNLMLATGEEFELLHVMQDVKSATILRGQNAIQPLNDYLGDYPHLSETLKERWPEFTVKGEVLAVPTKPNYYISRDYGRIFYRQDIFDKTGMEIPTTVDGVIGLGLRMQEILFQESGQKAYTWTHMLNRPMTWLHRTYEDAPFVVENTLGLVKFKMDGTVESFYESGTFQKDCEIYQKMYEAGLVHPDILTLDNEFKGNEGNFGRFLFGFETLDYPSTELNLQKNTGSTLNDFMLNPDMGNVIYFGIYNGNAIPTSCKNPESALKFLDWLYENEENNHLFMYGEEGRNYKRVGDLRAEFMMGPDGNPLYQYDGWQIGNADFALYNANATEKQLEVQTTPITGKIVRTPVVGFNFDTTNVANEMANLTTEVITSIYPIKFGLVDYDANIDQAIQRLKAAGLDNVIAEYASQYREHFDEHNWDKTK